MTAHITTAARTGTRAANRAGTARHASRLAVLALLVGMLAGTFTVLGTIVAPNAAMAASGDGTVETGNPMAPTQADDTFTRIKDVSTYLGGHGVVADVLHVERVGDLGFWFARYQDNTDGRRDFVWTWQPWGQKCKYANDANELVFNPWLNIYECLSDVTVADRLEPGHDYVRASAECRSSKPWGIGIRQPSGAVDCQSVGLMANRWAASTPGARAYYGCAPWESSPTNKAYCSDVHYSWETNGDPDLWVAAPDTCTGLPASYNARLQYDPETVPANPSCDGAALAPNCTPAQSDLAACGATPQYGLKTGWPENTPDGGQAPTDDFTAYATARGTGEAYTATITIGTTRSWTDERDPVKVTYSRMYRGKQFKATGDQILKITRSASATRTSTVTYNPIEVTANASCTKPTQAEAEQCAADKAYADAVAQSSATAKRDAIELATNDATKSANDEAVRDAFNSANKAKPTSAEIKTAKNAALAEAKKKVAKMIAEWEKTH